MPLRGDDSGELPIREAPDLRSNPPAGSELAGDHALAVSAENGSVDATDLEQGPGQDWEPTKVSNPGNAADNQRAKRQSNDTRPGFLPRHPVAVVVAIVLVVIAATAGYLYWDYARHFESTDDAFIDARLFTEAPKVSGYITAVPVTDNQHVEAGDVIARIDDRDYRVALEQADAQVAVAEANIQNIDAQIIVQQAQVGVAQAQVRQAQATLEYAQQEAARYQDLAKKGAGTIEQAQQYTSQLHQQQAALEQAQVSVTATQRQIESLKAQRRSTEASLAQTRAQRDQAQLNLSDTTVMAAQSGQVVNLTGAIGQFVQAGTALAMFVPDEIWVTANYKETQLTYMRPGQPLTLSVDAYPERSVHGHVANIQPGSGTAFSLLPAQNATGNYVKIVQRVPVKLILEDPPTDVAIGPGMSVEPTVRVRPESSLYERLPSFYAWLRAGL